MHLNYCTYGFHCCSACFEEL